MERFSIWIPVNGILSWIDAASKADAEAKFRDMHGIPPELEIEVETENEYNGRDEWGAYTDEREPEIE